MVDRSMEEIKICIFNDNFNCTKSTATFNGQNPALNASYRYLHRNNVLSLVELGHTITTAAAPRTYRTSAISTAPQRQTLQKVVKTTKTKQTFTEQKCWYD